jgi:hypothetical protein
MNPIMTPDHPKWTEFMNRLWAGRLPCCHNHHMSRAILADFDVDIERSIAYLREHGGYCDCEVLFNVDNFDHAPI